MNLASKLAGVAALALAAACATTPAETPVVVAAAAPPPVVAPVAPPAPTPPPAPVAAPVVSPPPEYVTIKMEIDVAKPAADVWAKVGADYCSLGDWIAPQKIPCVVTKGDGGIGSVRLIAGRVTEVMTAKSDLSYGYTQPAVDGKWYNLYHGFLEAKAVNAKSSKLIYTLMYDVADKKDQAAKDADVAAKRKQFEGALANMKKLAEAK